MSNSNACFRCIAAALVLGILLCGIAAARLIASRPRIEAYRNAALVQEVFHDAQA